MYAKREFDLNVYTYSDTAVRLKIKNEPNEEAIENLRYLHEKIIVPLLDVIDGKIMITSGYRSPELNKVLKGSKTSQHCKGQAIDIIYLVNGITQNKVLFDFIKENLIFDQLIWEKNGTWIHVSITKGKNRRQVLNL